MKRVLSLGTLALGVAMLAGCPGPKGPTIVPVEGTLTVDGQPMEKIRVEFWPESEGPNSVGVTDAQGHFVMETVEQQPRKGAAEGMHRVAVQDASLMTKFVGRAEDVDLTDGKVSRVSLKLANITTSGLSQSISGPVTDLKLDVKAYSEEEAKEIAAEGAKAGAAPGASGGSGGDRRE